MKVLKTLKKDHFEAASNITRNGSKKADKDLVTLLNEVMENANLVSLLSDAGSGGAAQEALTVTGLLATDTVLSVSQSVKGANNLPLLSFSVPAADALTCDWSADPGAGSKVLVLVLRVLAT